MNTYNPIGRARRLVFVVATLALSLGSLQLLAGAMTHPDPEAIAVRTQFIAAEGVRAEQLRALERGEVRYADATVGR